MAKKKKRKSLLPKRIAGVKVPKAVRKGRFGELLASQTGRALLAEALLAAGAIGGAKKAGDAVVDKAADAPSLRGFATGVAGRLKEGSAKDAGTSGAALAAAVGEAARAFITAMNAHGQPPEAAVETDWTAQDEDGGSKKKAQILPVPARLTPAEAPQARRSGMAAKAAAFGARSLVRFAHWRGRRDAMRELKRSGQQSFRGMIQINLIRTN